MLETASRLEFTDSGFESFLSARGEPIWLSDQRQRAWETFGRLAWPEGRGEEWLRTDVRLFKLDAYSLSPEASLGKLADTAPSLPTARLREGVPLAGQTASLNGVSIQSRLDPKWARRGVLFGSLAQLVAEHGDLIRPHLMSRAFRPSHDRFAALHAAWWTAGTLLYVPRGVTVDEPLHAFQAMTDGGIDLDHTLVVLEEDAEATLLSECASRDATDKGFHCGGIELIVGPGARLRYVNLQNWGHGVWHFAHQKAVVDRDASVQWTIAAIGSRLAKVNQQVELVGPGARSQVNGVLFTEGKQHLSYHTLQHHASPRTTSDFLYKAALQDSSRTVWRGMIKVDPGAVKTDGYQRNDNLLLSTKARADSIPGLEIEADDVRCTHGSTTGKIDEELLFYAMCRGFTRREAARMIVRGFFQQIFDRITIESVREALGQAIAQKVQEYR